MAAFRRAVTAVADVYCTDRPVPAIETKVIPGSLLLRDRRDRVDRVDCPEQVHVHNEPQQRGIEGTGRRILRPGPQRRRVSPAMAAGVESWRWSMEDVIALIDEHGAHHASAADRLVG
jgi:hypothetical protein